MKHLIFTALFLLLAAATSIFSQTSGPGCPASQGSSEASRYPTGDYWPKRLVFKIQERFRPYCSESQIRLTTMSSYLNLVNGFGLQKVFPRSTSPSPKTNAIGERLADLSLIYRLDYANNFSEKEA
ncbi:MAG: hypothetical protein RLZZ165_702, partial [Bacteroidota bacterium]